MRLLQLPRPHNAHIPSIAALACICALVAGCGPFQEPPFTSGGIYSVEDGSGEYRLVKLLAYDSTTVHIRFYQQLFEDRPTPEDVESLVEPMLPGDKHRPLTRDLFTAWRPEILDTIPLTETELAPYKDWQTLGKSAIGTD